MRQIIIDKNGKVMGLKEDRTQVMRVAHALEEATGKSFEVCLAKAWGLHRLVKEMRRGTVTFSYEKRDGSLRKAKGTLKGVEKHLKPKKQDEKRREPSPRCLVYYDVEAGGFRSFRVENLVAVY